MDKAEYERFASGEPSWLGQEMELGRVLEKPEAPEELIEGLYEVEKLTLLFSPPGTFKTNWALDSGLCVAASVPFLPRRDGKALKVIQAPVVIISQDMAGAEIKRRLHALMNGHGIRSMPPLHIYSFPDPPLDLSAGADQLLEVIEHHKARLVFIDNLSNALGGIDENSSAVGAAIMNLARIRDLTGASINVLHHPAKAEGWSRGHGSILANVDESVRFKRKKDEPYLTFEPEKQRGAGIFKKIIARWSYELYEGSRIMRWARFEQATEEEYQDAGIEEFESQIMDFVKDNPGAPKSEVYRNVSGDWNVLKRAVDRLTAAGLLTIHINGRAHRLYLPDDAPVKG